MRKGHGDLAARRSLLDLPDIDLPCPLFMILPDGWDSVRFLEIVLNFGRFSVFKLFSPQPPVTHTVRLL
jgi:hypothetical protein